MPSVAELKSAGNDALRAGDFAGAIAKYTEAIELDPKGENVHALYSNRSAAHVAVSNFEDALKDGKKCVETKREWPKGHARVAYAQFRKRLYGAAEKSYKSAASLAKEQGDDASAAKYEKSAQECAQEDRYVRGIDKRPEAQATTASSSSSTLATLPRTLLFAARTAQLCLALGYLVSPFLGSLLVPAALFRLLLLIARPSLIVHTLVLSGKPRISNEYAGRVFLDYRLQYALLCGAVLMLGRGRPYAFLVILIIVMEIGFWAESLHTYAGPAARSLESTANAIVPRLLGAPAADWATFTAPGKWSAFNHWATQMAATCEVGLGFLLIVELALPVRNPMLLLVYWQMIRMRCMTSTHVKGIFDRFDALVRPYALRIPILGSVYAKIAQVLGRMVALPRPGEQTAARPRCSVM